MSSAAVHRVPVTMQLVELLGSQSCSTSSRPGSPRCSRRGAGSGICLPRRCSRCWSRRSSSTSRGWRRGRCCRASSRPPPGPQPWFSGSVPAVTQTRMPVPSTVHMSVVAQPHCGRGLAGLSSQGVPLLDEELWWWSWWWRSSARRDPEDCEEPRWALTSRSLLLLIHHRSPCRDFLRWRSPAPEARPAPEPRPARTIASQREKEQA